jgi:hypothetical protein
MAIPLDDQMFQQIIEVTLGAPRLEPAAARSVIAIAELAAAIDLAEAPEENAILGALERRLCALAGLELSTLRPLSPIPTDDEERRGLLARLVAPLAASRARELAYAAAYLVIVTDLELAPIETRLLEDIRRALDLSPPCAAELAARVAQIATFTDDDQDAGQM